MCLDHAAIIERWSRLDNPRPVGMVYVRTYGASFNAEDLFADIKALSPAALIIDDRCLCPPSFVEDLSANCDAMLFSTGHAKYADIDFGGYGILRDGINYQRTALPFSKSDLDYITEQYKASLARRTRFAYSDSNWLSTDAPHITWESYRVSVEQECLKAAALKSKINEVYVTGLPPQIQFPSEFQSWRFNIHVRDKESVLSEIRRSGLFASGHYDALSGVFGSGSCPATQLVHKHVINLFNDRHIGVERARELACLLADIQGLEPSPLFS